MQILRQPVEPEVDIDGGREPRRDFRLYVDEFQNYVSGDFASILSEARKYRLSLTVAHQYLSQLDEETANAVWGNVGSIVAFRSGVTMPKHWPSS